MCESLNGSHCFHLSKHTKMKQCSLTQKFIQHHDSITRLVLKSLLWHVFYYWTTITVYYYFQVLDLFLPSHHNFQDFNTGSLFLCNSFFFFFFCIFQKPRNEQQHKNKRVERTIDYNERAINFISPISNMSFSLEVINELLWDINWMAPLNSKLTSIWYTNRGLLFPHYL